MVINSHLTHKEREEWTITTQIVLICALLTSLFALLWVYAYCVSVFAWGKWINDLRGLSIGTLLTIALGGLVYTCFVVNKLLDRWENGVKDAVRRVGDASYKTFYKRFRQYQAYVQTQLTALSARFDVFFTLHKLGDRGDAEDSESFTAAARYNQLN